jgi:Holliday junction DNA helicase RuvA
MIGQVSGRLVTKELDRVEVATASGVAYELAVPLSTYEALPRAGEAITLFTHLVVRDDDWSLFGFATDLERRVFRRLLGATGVGPALALGMLSRFAADRLIRAIRERDVATLQSVPRVGRKKAQQLVLDLADKLDDLLAPEPGAPRPQGQVADDAIRALVSLGYAPNDAEKAVRAALDGVAAPPSAPELIRAALTRVGKR